MEKKYRLMTAISRHYRTTYIIALILVIGFCVDLHETTKTGVADYAVVGGCLVYMGAVNLYIRIKYTQINRFLMCDCNPEPYITAYRYIIAQFSKGKKPINSSALWVSLSTGLIVSGHYSEAFDALRKCKTFSHKRRGRLTKIVYHNNLISVYMALEQMDKAVEQLENMKNIISYLKAYKRKKAQIERLYSQNECRLRMANGDYKNVENVFLKMATHAKSNYERVIAHSWLGKVYAHTGQESKAHKAFEYVVANGNNLYAVTLAKEALMDMGGF